MENLSKLDFLPKFFETFPLAVPTGTYIRVLQVLRPQHQCAYWGCENAFRNTNNFKIQRYLKLHAHRNYDNDTSDVESESIPESVESK